MYKIKDNKSGLLFPKEYHSLSSANTARTKAVYASTEMYNVAVAESAKRYSVVKLLTSRDLVRVGSNCYAIKYENIGSSLECALSRTSHLSPKLSKSKGMGDFILLTHTSAELLAQELNSL